MAPPNRMGYEELAVDEPTILPPKMDVARALLLRGSLFVHLDPRIEGVAVPAWLREQPQLVLQMGLDMPIPIPDLRVDDEGVFGTLSFSRSPYRCEVPWTAVFALVGDDGRGMVWPDDLPAEIAAEVEREAARRVAPRTESELGSAPLSLVKGGAAAASPTTDQPGGAGRRSRELPPYLRVIK